MTVTVSILLFPQTWAGNYKTDNEFRAPVIRRLAMKIYHLVQEISWKETITGSIGINIFISLLLCHFGKCLCTLLYFCSCMSLSLKTLSRLSNTAC